MKKWAKILGLMMIAFVFSFVFNADASAEQVTGVVQTEGAGDHIRIKCQEVPGAFLYHYILTESVTGETKNGDSYSSETVVNNLSPGKTYILRVIAYNGGNMVASASDPIEVTTAPNTNKYSVSQADATAKSVTLMAAGADDANYYVVRMGTEKIAESDSAFIKVTGLMPNTNYEFNVFAARRSAAGFIAEGLFKTCTVKTRDINGDDLKTPEDNEFGISSQSIKEDAYTFFVYGNAESDGYELEFQDMNGVVKKTEKTTSMNPVIERYLLNGNFYKYHVRTYIKYGATEMFSGWSSFKYMGVMVKASAKKSKKALTLSWNPVNGTKNYVVYASTNEQSGFKKLKSVTGNSLKVTKVNGKKLKKGKKYYFRIDLVSKDGQKEVKSPVSYSFSASF